MNGLASARTTTLYTSLLFLPSEIDEYDFGATTLLRKTINTYLTANSDITNKPTSKTVKNSSGTILSQETFGYDESAVSGTSGVVQHMATGGQRANLTSDTKWRNTDGALLNTTYTYDDTGQRLTMKDANGNPPTKWS